MIIPSAKEQIIAIIEKRGFEAQKMKEGLFILKAGEIKIGIDIASDKPVVGIFLNNILREDGHGNQKVYALRDEIMHIWEKGMSKEKKETLAPKDDEAKKEQISAPKIEEVPKRNLVEELKSEPKEEVNKMEEKKHKPKEAEIVKDNLPARKQDFKVGTCEAVAVQYGIPLELANLFFMKMNEGLYIKNPGLLYLAGKKGYSRIEITDQYNEQTQEWSAECKIYPKISKELLEGISKLDKEMQKQAFDFLTSPTNGTGRASKNNVKMTTMQAFLREMAQTRAQNRALRAFTGYGGTSAEELPEGKIED